MVYLTASQLHSGEFPKLHLCKEFVHMPLEVRTLLSEHHGLRDISKLAGVHPGDILHNRSSFFTAAVHLFIQLAIISKFVSVKSLAVFIGGFPDFSPCLIDSLI